MLSRALWITLLALLAWIPRGRAESRVVRTGNDRALFVVSALDVASDSPARIGERNGLTRELTNARRPATPRPLPVHESDGERVAGRAAIWRPAVAPTPSGWRGFQETRLIAPHDATAPPPRRS